MTQSLHHSIMHRSTTTKTHCPTSAHFTAHFHTRIFLVYVATTKPMGHDPIISQGLNKRLLNLEAWLAQTQPSPHPLSLIDHNSMPTPCEYYESKGTSQDGAANCKVCKPDSFPSQSNIKWPRKPPSDKENEALTASLKHGNGRRMNKRLWTDEREGE